MLLPPSWPKRTCVVSKRNAWHLRRPVDRCACAAPGWPSSLRLQPTNMRVGTLSRPVWPGQSESPQSQKSLCATHVTDSRREQEYVKRSGDSAASTPKVAVTASSTADTPPSSTPVRHSAKLGSNFSLTVPSATLGTPATPRRTQASGTSATTSPPTGNRQTKEIPSRGERTTSASIALDSLDSRDRFQRPSTPGRASPPTEDCKHGPRSPLASPTR